MTTDPAKRPHFAYENPADLAWSARMVNTWAKRRRARIAAEVSGDVPTNVAGQPTSQLQTAREGGGDDE